MHQMRYVCTYVYHCQQDCFWCSGHHQISYCMCVHLHIHILVLCMCVSVPLCMCTNPSICVHLCAMNIPHPLHCDWLAKVHVTSASAHCSLQCSPYSLVSSCMLYTQVPAATRQELTQSLQTDSIELIGQVQVDYECCGVDNYSDWFNTTWSRDNQGLLAPESCCSKNEIWNNCSSVPDNIYAHVSQSCIRMHVCVCLYVRAFTCVCCVWLIQCIMVLTACA